MQKQTGTRCLLWITTLLLSPPIACSEDGSSCVKHRLQSFKVEGNVSSTYKRCWIERNRTRGFIIVSWRLDPLPCFSPALRATGAALGSDEQLEIPGENLSLDQKQNKSKKAVFQSCNTPL